MISIVMSVYNGEKYLDESIVSILNQSFKDYEFIIINDGSTDNSLNIISRYAADPRIIIINHENYGISKSVNEGIARSRYELIARMDADDISHADRLGKQFNFMQQNKNCGVLGTQSIIMDQAGKDLYKSTIPLDDSNLKQKLPHGSPFFNGSVIFRKSLFNLVGGYNEYNRQYNEDKELWIKMMKVTEFNNLAEYLYKYRVTPSSGSLRNKRVEKRIQKIIQKEKLSKKDKILLYRHYEKNEKEKKYLYNIKIGKIYLERCNNKKDAMQHLMRAFLHNPFNISLIYNILLLFLPMKLILKFKNLDYSL